MIVIVALEASALLELTWAARFAPHRMTPIPLDFTASTIGTSMPWRPRLRSPSCRSPGVLFGIRTIFDPTIGPARLLFAFEVVIIGGLGSLWGTLAGGIILGIAQAVGGAFDPSWDTFAGHIVFLIVLLCSTARPLSQDVRPMSSIRYRIERSTRGGRLGFAVLRAADPRAGIGSLRGRAARKCVCWSRCVIIWLSRKPGILLAGYAGLVSVGQQAFVGLGCYGFLIATVVSGINPLLALPLTGLLVALAALPILVDRIPLARGVLCDRNVGAGRSPATLSSLSSSRSALAPV